MREIRYESKNIKCVLAGMVMNQVVCSRIAAKWPKEGLFDSPHENLIAGWCVRYWRKYQQAPQKNIQPVFENWAAGRNGDNQTTTKLVETTMQEISRYYEKEDEIEQTVDFVLDIARDLFDTVRLRKLKELIDEDLEENNVQAARDRIQNCRLIELGKGSVIRPEEDIEMWHQVFEREEKRVLIRYRDGLGKFFGNSLSRENFIGIMAPDKTGKSWWLMDMSFQALWNRQRVAYFEIGDMGVNDAMIRLGQRALRRPIKRNEYEWPISINENGSVEKEIREENDELSPVKIFRAFRKLSRNESLYRMSCHSNSSISVDGIASILQDWINDGWYPDVVIIDYADILAPIAGIKDKLEQIDENWKRLRRLAQDNHCLVLTATQSNASAYSGKQRALSKKHFSGNKMKLAHVNGMVGINVTEADVAKGVMKLNWVVLRKGRYLENRFCTVAGCLDAACPAICSTY